MNLIWLCFNNTTPTVMTASSQMIIVSTIRGECCVVPRKVVFYVCVRDCRQLAEFMRLRLSGVKLASRRMFEFFFVGSMYFMHGLRERSDCGRDREGFYHIFKSINEPESPSVFSSWEDQQCFHYVFGQELGTNINLVMSVFVAGEIL